MKIAYLIDLKKALKNIPDDVLDVIGWGVGEDSEGVDMCVWDEDYIEKWEKYNKEYPQLEDIRKWIKNIQKAQIIMDGQESEEFDDMEEPIASDYKFK